jgi:hypothetical protein
MVPSTFGRGNSHGRRVATPVESVVACRREIAELPSEVRTASWLMKEEEG